MFPASFLDDQEKKELLRELRKAFGMEDKVSVMIMIALEEVANDENGGGLLEHSNFLSCLS